MKSKAASDHRRLAVLIVILLSLSSGLIEGQAQELTEEPGPAPTVTDVPPTVEVVPEQTTEAISTPEATSAITEPAPTATPDAAPTAVVTPAPMDEPAPNASPLEVVFVCLEDGPAFVITNHGPDMTDPAYYERVGDIPAVAEPTPEAPSDMPTEQPAEAPADESGSPDGEEPTPEPLVDNPVVAGTPFVLAAGDSLTVSGTSLRIGDEVYAADSSCQAAPVLSVSAVCAFETGVTFTIENSGGPMIADQPYSVASGDAQVNGAFLLGANESITVNAGFGEPVFTSSELTSALDAPCYAPAQVTGVIWNDLDHDGARSETEPGIPNVAVQLIDPAGFALTAVTASDGSYGFGLLPNTSFTVRVDNATLPPEYALTTPVGGDASVALDVLMGLTYSVDFGFASLPSASIGGTVWLETGNFGVRDGSEMGVSGAMVELLDATGTVIATSAVDAATGAYGFGELYAGTYTVRLAQATLFTPIGVTWDRDGDLSFETTLVLESGQALEGADFGVVGTF